jgi:hypothetical protein
VKKIFLATAVMLLLLVSGAEAFNANFTTSDGRVFLDLSQNNTINISIGAMSNNITEVELRYTTNLAGSPLPDLYINYSNGTSGTSVNFTDRTNYTASAISRTYLFNFTNGTATPLIQNGSTQQFWINVAARRMDGGSGAMLALQITARDINGQINTSTINFYPSFAFTGYIVNETGCSTCWQNATNMSIYGVTYSQNSPPSSTLLATTLTNASGYFRLRQVNASASFSGFQLKMIYYNSTGTATKTGMIMPQFPAMMYYGAGMEGEFDMSLNGATFYLQPAHTINISASNGTAPVSFGYEIVDQALGFPVESQSQQKVTNAQIVLPANRGYTVSFFRMPAFGGGSTSGYNFDPSCATSDFMNDTLCPTPPKTYAISASNASAGNTTTINQSLIVRKVNVWGCLTPQAGANNSVLNITSIKVKMLPWTTDAGSFVPPTSGDDGRINITTSINYTVSGCQFAQFNLSLLNQTSYMIEFYAKNGSSEASDPGSANNLAAFLNFSATDNLVRNGSLFKLAGTYRLSNVTSVPVNTSSIKINVINSSGGAVTTSINANVKVKNSQAGIGTVFYMIDSNAISNGSFYLPIFNNSNYAKVMIFSQNGPPKEVRINLSASEMNITVASMGMDKGFRKFHANGSLGTVNTSSTPIALRFLRNTPECAIANAPSDCLITEMNASAFNPLKAMLAGKVHMEVKITSTNVSLIFKDYDMMSARQPPMESILEENATGRSTTDGSSAVSDTWNFGSFAPSDSYSNVTIIIPYSDSSSHSSYLNESAQVNMSIPVLYDENNLPLWNRTSGHGHNNLTDDFIKYNQTFYRELLNSTGIRCISGGLNNTCSINTTSNFLALHLPHFSTVGAVVSGSATVASSASTSSSSGSGGGGGSGSGGKTYTISQEQLTNGYEKTLYAYDKIRSNISGQYHTVMLIKISSTGATINVSSTPQQRVILKGTAEKFDVTEDGKYDLSVTVHETNTTAGWARVTVAKTENTAMTDTPEENNEETTSGSGSGKAAGVGEERLISNNTWWTIAVIAAIIILAILIAIIATKYQEYKEKDKSRRIRVYGNIAK